MKTLIKFVIGLILAVVVLAVVAVIGVSVFFDPNDYKSQITDAVAEKTGRAMTIDGDIDWNFFPWLALEVNDIKVKNLAEFGDGNLAEVKQLAASVKLLPLLGGNVEMGDTTLDGVALNLITNKAGRSNLDPLLVENTSTESSEGDGSSQQSSALSLGKISVTDLTVNRRDQRVGTTQNIAVKEFSLASFSPGESADFSLELAVDDSAQQFASTMQASGALLVDKAMENISIKGLDFSGDVKSPLLAEPTTLSLNSDVNVVMADATRVTLPDARWSLGDTSGNLNLDARLGQRNKVQFGLDSDAIDLDSLLPAADDSGEAAAEKSAGAEESPFNWLGTNDIDGTIKVAKLTSSGVTVSNLNAKAVSRNGVLNLSDIGAELFQGKLTGTAQVNARQNPAVVSFKPTLSNVAVGDALEQILGVGVLSATGDVALDLSMRGIKPEQIMNSLSGTGSLDLLNGAINGIDLRKIAEEGLSLQSLANFQTNLGGTTEFATAKTAFSAKDGNIRLNNLQLLSDLFELSGTGLTALSSGTLDYDMSLLLKGLLKDKLVEKYPQLADGKIPLSVKGSFTDPKASLDLQSLLKAQVDEKIDKKKDELKDKLKDKLLDKLKF